MTTMSQLVANEAQTRKTGEPMAAGPGMTHAMLGGLYYGETLVQTSCHSVQILCPSHLSLPQDLQDWLMQQNPPIGEWEGGRGGDT